MMQSEKSRGNILYSYFKEIVPSTKNMKISQVCKTGKKKVYFFQKV